VFAPRAGTDIVIELSTSLIRRLFDPATSSCAQPEDRHDRMTERLADRERLRAELPSSARACRPAGSREVAAESFAMVPSVIRVGDELHELRRRARRRPGSTLPAWRRMCATSSSRPGRGGMEASQPEPGLVRGRVFRLISPERSTRRRARPRSRACGRAHHVGDDLRRHAVLQARSGAVVRQVRLDQLGVPARCS